MNISGTLLINPHTYKVNGFVERIFNSGDILPKVPFLKRNENNLVTGLDYVEPITYIGNKDFYINSIGKTYNPETNSFI